MPVTPSDLLALLEAYRMFLKTNPFRVELKVEQPCIVVRRQDEKGWVEKEIATHDMHQIAYVEGTERRVFTVFSAWVWENPESIDAVAHWFAVIDGELQELRDKT